MLRTLSALIALTLVGCTAQLPLHSDFFEGMAKSAVLEKFGEPDSKDVMQANLRVDGYGEELPVPVYEDVWRYKSRQDPAPSESVGIYGETFVWFSSDLNPAIVRTGWLSNDVLQAASERMSSR